MLRHAVLVEAVVQKTFQARADRDGAEAQSGLDDLSHLCAVAVATLSAKAGVPGSVDVRTGWHNRAFGMASER